MKKLLFLLLCLPAVSCFAQLNINKDAREGGLVSEDKRAEYVFNLIKSGRPAQLAELDNYLRTHKWDMYLNIQHYDKDRLTQTLPMFCYAVDQGLTDVVKIYLKNGIPPTYECKILSHSEKWRLTSHADGDGWIVGSSRGGWGRPVFTGTFSYSEDTRTLVPVTKTYFVKPLDYASGPMFDLLWKNGFRSESLFKDKFLKEAIISGKKEVAAYIWANRIKEGATTYESSLKMETSNPLLNHFIWSNDFNGAAAYLTDKAGYEKYLLGKRDAQLLSLFIMSEPALAADILKELKNAGSYAVIQDVFSPYAVGALDIPALTALENMLSQYKAKPVWETARTPGKFDAASLASAAKSISDANNTPVPMLGAEAVLPKIYINVKITLASKQNARLAAQIGGVADRYDMLSEVLRGASSKAPEINECIMNATNGSENIIDSSLFGHSEWQTIVGCGGQKGFRILWHDVNGGFYCLQLDKIEFLEIQNNKLTVTKTIKLNSNTCE